MEEQQSCSLPPSAGDASSKPLVSVIMAFLNAVRFVEEAIESVFAQTYPRWEMLLVDDGSTDGSGAVALRYAEKYPEKVRLLAHEGRRNRGISASRNLGLRHASGAHIAPLDADDVWLPQKLARQVTIASLHPEASMIYGLDQWWYSWTGNPEDSQRDFVYQLGVTLDTLIQPPTLAEVFFFRQQGAIPCPSGVLLRRETVEGLGGFEESFWGLNNAYEDQAFYAKVCLNAPVFAAAECWNKYRQHPRSACSVVRSKGQEYAARQFFLSWLDGYLAKQGMRNGEMGKALTREQWRCRHPRLHALWTSRPTRSLRPGRS